MRRNAVIKGLTRTDKFGNSKLDLTTSKIRNILSMVSELYTDAQHSREDKLDADMVSRVQYLKMRIAYEAGRERSVKDFVLGSRPARLCRRNRQQPSEFDFVL